MPVGVQLRMGASWGTALSWGWMPVSWGTVPIYNNATGSYVIGHTDNMAAKIDSDSVDVPVPNTAQSRKPDEPTIVSLVDDERPVRAVLFFGLPHSKALKKKPIRPSQLREVSDTEGRRHYRKCFVDAFPHEETPGKWCTGRCIEEIYNERYVEVSSMVLVFHIQTDQGSDFHPQTPSPGTLIYEMIQKCPLLEHLQIQGWGGGDFRYYRNNFVKSELLKLLPRWPAGSDGGPQGESPDNSIFGRALELKSVTLVKCCLADGDLESIPWCLPNLKFVVMYYCGGYSRAVVDQWLSMFYKCYTCCDYNPSRKRQLYHSFDCGSEMLDEDTFCPIPVSEYPVLIHDRGEVSGSDWDINREGSRHKNAEYYYKDARIYWGDDECQF